jgi:hypothetical protein
MKIAPFSIAARVTIATLLLIVGVALFALALFVPVSKSATPANGTVTATGPAVSWDGTAVGSGSAGGEQTCVEGVNCDTFMLTVGGTKADWAGKRVEVTISFAVSTNDYDLVVHKHDNSGAIVDTSGSGAGSAEVAHINPATDGVGLYSVHVIYFVAAPAPPDQYHGTAVAVPLVPQPPPPAPKDNGLKVGYENFEVPGELTPVTTTTGSTVEYMGRNAGEPSIGNNWNTGVTNFQSDLETLFITFQNGCPAAGPIASWVNRRAPTSQVIDSDPIGFTDRATGRTFAAELTATSPTCKISYTDDDGQTWIASPGTVASGIDHETIGGGPYAPPLPTGVVYPHAIYYCSQDLVAAFCLRSDDGGETYGPPVQTYTTECGGLHGHVKVAPDGTVYLPNNDCGGDGAVVVSEDNGITWKIRKVGNGTSKLVSGNSDPAVAIDNNNRVYFGMANADSAAAVAVSDNHGSTWKNIYDVSAAYGLKNIRYPAAVAGDNGRAAIAFYGTTTAGSANSASFNGEWHLYVAHTFDGGSSWTTTDATPGAPIQRGCIWTGGGANICRNLLDFFDITIDKQGRVEVGYVNGCAGGNCAQAAPTAVGNAYSATATIARQSSGRRLVAAFDPPSLPTVPGIPTVTQRRVGSVVHLAWSEGDSGNSPITNYRIFRGTKKGDEQLLTSVPGTQTAFDDGNAADKTKTYYYKVEAVNAIGASCSANEIAAPYLGDTCSGVVIHQNDPTHPESTAAAANPALAIDYISVGEPTEPAGSNFMFKMKVADLSTVPPNSRWRIVWDSYASPGQQFYVGMNSDASGGVTFVRGTVATAVVGLVVGVPEETERGAALPQSNFKPDGTITIYVPKAKVGNPNVGDLLGAVNGRTFADNSNLERSTSLIDHTFVKAQTDNAYPAATYTVAGNADCAISLQEAQLLNISTRALVKKGDEVLIGGFIVTGSVSKPVLVRAIGPSLQSNGQPLPGRLNDPTLELHGPNGAIIDTNDNWQDQQKAEIEATGVAPTNNRESAILRSLKPGRYTVVMAGKNGGTGIGLVEAYDLAPTAQSKLANISSRGFVGLNDNVMIGGFFAGPGDAAATNIVVRALGPSLAAAGVHNALQDPSLELHDQNGATVATNDNWETDSNSAKVTSEGLAPTDPRESALYTSVRATNYTAVVRGKDGDTGVGIVEVYDVK